MEKKETKFTDTNPPKQDEAVTIDKKTTSTKKTTANKSTSSNKTTTTKKPAQSKTTSKSDTTKKSGATTKKTTTAKKPASTTKKPAAEKTSSDSVAEISAIEPQNPVQTTAIEASVTDDRPIEKEVDQSKHVLYVCSEAQPFIGTGGLSDVMGALPKSINRKNDGVEIRVVLPLYSGMHHDYKQKLEFMFSTNVPVAWRNQYCGVFRLEHEGVTFYFIDNEYYFKRQNIYGYYDDGERFTFLSRAALEILPKLDWRIDVLHCHDWHTALVPIYYKLFYQYREGLGGIKTVFTIHNIEYQGKYGRSIIEDVFGIPDKEYGSIEYDGNINLMKGAIDYSDVVTTVSPTYADELRDPFFAYGLEKIIQKNAGKIVGILNGIDTETNDPATNPSLFVNYDIDSIQNKNTNKTELQKMIGLPESPNTPLVAIVSRLVPHKGLELIKYALHSILMHDIQLVILGTGMPALEEYFSHIQLEFSNKISTIIAYNKDLSQKIYAGADMFLMPSKSEPCGLSQMIAMRYGTVPIVRSTGGLRDTVRDYGEGDGNGFVFHDFDVLALTVAIDRAVGLYANNKPEWNKLVYSAMKMNFAWDSSANEYIKLYK